MLKPLNVMFSLYPYLLIFHFFKYILWLTTNINLHLKFHKNKNAGLYSLIVVHLLVRCVYTSRSSELNTASSRSSELNVFFENFENGGSFSIQYFNNTQPPCEVRYICVVLFRFRGCQCSLHLGFLEICELRKLPNKF